MTKDINALLCKLCGIKPCYGIYVDYGDLGNLKPEFYPDFTKPENFVKLLEIIHNNTNIGAFLICDLCHGCPFTEDFLRVLNKFLTGKMEYSKGFINEIKRSIREAEWVYD